MENKDKKILLEYFSEKEELSNIKLLLLILLLYNNVSFLYFWIIISISLNVFCTLSTPFLICSPFDIII